MDRQRRCSPTRLKLSHNEMTLVETFLKHCGQKSPQAYKNKYDNKNQFPMRECRRNLECEQTHLNDLNTIFGNNIVTKSVMTF